MSNSTQTEKTSTFFGKWSRHFSWVTNLRYKVTPLPPHLKYFDSKQAHKFSSTLVEYKDASRGRHLAEILLQALHMKQVINVELVPLIRTATHGWQVSFTRTQHGRTQQTSHIRTTNNQKPKQLDVAKMFQTQDRNALFFGHLKTIFQWTCSCIAIPSYNNSFFVFIANSQWLRMAHWRKQIVLCFQEKYKKGTWTPLREGGRQMHTLWFDKQTMAATSQRRLLSWNYFAIVMTPRVKRCRRTGDNHLTAFGQDLYLNSEK